LFTDVWLLAEDFTIKAARHTKRAVQTLVFITVS
jgi:hypothetical protein